MTTTAADTTDAPAGGGDERGRASGRAPASHGTHGYAKHKDQHLKRLRRIEGQIRGLQRMVEEDVYCIDILTQVSASTKALQSFALQLLEEHLRHCVASAAVESAARDDADDTDDTGGEGAGGKGAGGQGGDEVDAKVAEATAAIARLLRT